MAFHPGDVRYAAQARARVGPRVRTRPKVNLEAVLRPRIVVFGSSVDAVVRSVGGWVADHALAGWSVVVLPAVPADPRPLHILGASAGDLEEFVAVPLQTRRAWVVAMDAELCVQDARVGGYVAGLSEGRSVDVRFWNEPSAVAGIERHRLSLAAHAFKAAALSAITVGGEDAESAETFEVAPRPDDLSTWRGVGVRR